MARNDDTPSAMGWFLLLLVLCSIYGAKGCWAQLMYNDWKCGMPQVHCTKVEAP